MKDHSIFIGGPSGSGKTAVAESLARKIKGEIISCDSRTIYRRFDIGTGKMGNSKEIPYHMVDIIDPGEVMPVYHLVIEARKKIEEVKERGSIPIICGGSHFWMERLLKGMKPTPPPDPGERNRLRDLERKKGNGTLHNMLKDLDQDLASKVHSNNLSRILRYLEIAKQNKIIPAIAPLEGRWNIYFLAGDIESLKKRIETRTTGMIENGWKEEVIGLIDDGIEPPIPGTDSIGYPDLYQLLSGKIDLGSCIYNINSKTVRLAKDQMKWSRRLDDPEIFDIDEINPDGMAGIISDLIKSGV